MRPQDVLDAAGVRFEGRPERLSGGDMGEVWRCGDVVVKSHPRPPDGLFPAEARGLRRMAVAGVRVPEVHWVSNDGIVLEWLGDGPSDPEGLGRQVARLHRTRAERYGSPDPLFLGRFPLPAGEGADWRTVFAEHRLRPLIRVTRGMLGDGAALVERVCDEVEPPIEGPVLVHGDLWSGNVHFGTDGPALIDPSCQVAERGLDLAMMDLFGGFGPRFWAAYEEIWPVPDEVRRAIPYHQLLYLLVHVHFFGRGYVRGTVEAARTALG